MDLSFNYAGRAGHQPGAGSSGFTGDQIKLASHTDSKPCGISRLRVKNRFVDKENSAIGRTDRVRFAKISPKTNL